MAEVRCDQCGRLLTPSEVRAGVCPSCGRPIVNAASVDDSEAAGLATDDDSGTRPMFPAQVPVSASPSSPPPTAPPPPPADALTAPATPISPYRPPALPRANAAATQEASAAAMHERTAALPAHLLPSEAAIAPSAGTGEPGGERKGGRFGWTSALALLIVLVLGAIAALLAANGQLGGILGAPPATPTTPPATSTAGPPPAPAGFVRYTAASFSIIYPKGWIEFAPPSGPVLFASPDADANVNVQISSRAGPQTLDDVYISVLGKTLLRGKPGTSTISHKTAPTQVSAAGTSWTREEADVTVTASGTTTTWHIAALAATHDQQTCLISFYAPASAFGAQDSAFFEPMVNSMLFISAQP